MDIGKALSEGFNVLEKHLVIFVPALLISLLTVYSNTFSTEGITTVQQLISWFSFYIPMMIIISLINIFLSAVVILLAFEGRKRKKVSLNRATKKAAKKYLSLLGATILVALAVFAGTIAFIIPGIYLAVKLMFSSYAILIDNKKATDSLKKSWEITKGRWWEVFALLLIIFIIAFAFGFVAGIFEIFSHEAYLIFSFFMYLFLIPWANASILFAYLQIRRK